MKEKKHNEKKKPAVEERMGLLDSMDKNSSGGFSAPENYFEMLSKNISDKVSVIPNLVSVPKENPFNIPDGYFVQLENAIQERVSSKGKYIPSPAGQWFRRPQLAPLFISAMILVLAVSSYLLININRPAADNDISFNDIYNSDYATELDETSLASLIDDPASVQSSNQLEDYVIDNDIDLSTLTDEL